MGLAHMSLIGAICAKAEYENNKIMTTKKKTNWNISQHHIKHLLDGYMLVEANVATWNMLFFVLALLDVKERKRRSKESPQGERCSKEKSKRDTL